jgi:hypothetical protein
MTQHSRIPARASRTVDHQATPSRGQVATDGEYDDPYPPRSHTSVIRYPQPGGQYVIQKGNKRIIVHDAPPRKRFPWLSLIGIGMIVALLLVWGFSWLGQWWTEHQLDATYGFPRTYQTDAIVYPGDSSAEPSHYIFLNLNGTVMVIELPHGDSSRARIYKGPTLFTDNAPLIPVTGEFKNVNGKEEMLVHIGDQTIIYINDGTQFKPKQ